MSEYLPDLITRLRLDTSEMEQGASRSAAIGGAIGGAVGVALAAGLGRAAGAVKDFVSGSVGAFSELEDTTAAAGVIFGDSMGTIIAQSQSAAGSLGLSSQQVIGAANTFGTYGKAAGLAGGDLAKFSTDMTGLAGDLASFKGTSPEQAIEAIGAALRGEAEPIRAYGVLLDDASLKARALAIGIGDGTSALTPQQKALAAQAEILAQTSDAQGDFARTSESTANVQKRLAAEAENVQAKFGTLLAPAFTAVRNVGIDMLGSLSGKLDEWIPKVQGFYDRTSTVLGGLRTLFADGDITGGLLDGLGVQEDSPLIDFIMTIRESAASIMPIITTLGPSVLQLVSSFSPLGLVLGAIVPVLPAISAALTQVLTAVAPLVPVVAQVASMLVGALVGAITALLPAVLSLLPVIGTLVQALGPVLGRIIEALAPIIVMLVEAIVQLLPPLLAIVNPVLAVVLALLPLVDIVAVLISTLLPPLIELFVALITPVLSLVSSLVTALLPAIDALLPVIELLIGLLAGLILAIMPVVQTILGALVGALSWLVQGLVNAALGLVRFVTAVVGGMARFVSAVANGIGEAIAWFNGLPGRIGGALGGLADKLLGFGRDAIQGFINGVSGMAGRVISAIRSTITDALPDFVKKALGIASPSKLLRGFGRNVGEGFALGIDDMVGRVAGSAADMAGVVSGVTVAPPSLGAGSSAFVYAAAVNPVGGAGANGGNASTEVRVYIGNEEITSRVRVEVIGVLTDEATAIAAGSAD